MKVSQLLHAMNKDDSVVIDDSNKPVDCMTIYSGPVRNIKKDDPINSMHIESVTADFDVICILACKAIDVNKKKGANHDKTRTVRIDL